jgi:NADP-dependent 3-hydroxy acid dehydrogenase YdfG
VQKGGQIVTVQLDVSDRAQVAALWSKIPQELRNVDILGALTYDKTLVEGRDASH